MNGKRNLNGRKVFTVIDDFDTGMSEYEEEKILRAMEIGQGVLVKNIEQFLNTVYKKIANCRGTKHGDTADGMIVCLRTLITQDGQTLNEEDRNLMIPYKYLTCYGIEVANKLVMDDYFDDDRPLST